MFNEKAQTLLELTIVIAVAVLVIGALTFATIGSLRNASFAKNQAQATKLAQEGIEMVRSIRDRNTNIQTINIGGSPALMPFLNLYNWFISSAYCSDEPCYFKLVSGVLNQVPGDKDYEKIEPGFLRQVRIFDRECPPTNDNCYKTQKEITVVVTWTDFSGVHQSKLTTYLRNPSI